MQKNNSKCLKVILTKSNLPHIDVCAAQVTLRSRLSQYLYTKVFIMIFSRSVFFHSVPVFCRKKNKNSVNARVNIIGREKNSAIRNWNIKFQCNFIRDLHRKLRSIVILVYNGKLSLRYNWKKLKKLDSNWCIHHHDSWFIRYSKNTYWLLFNML